MSARGAAATLLGAASLAAAGGLLAFLVLWHLSYPLLWQDEAETIMYAERILDFGYPKVHDGRNVVYGLSAPISVGVKERHDAYIGSTWGQNYFGALGAAWARGVGDPYAKTWRVRLPFALAGLTGVALLIALGASVLEVSVPARLGLAALFFLLVSLSPSHALHLREARHYPLVVLLVACCLWVYVRFHVLRRMAFAAYGSLLAVLLFLLFNVFSLPWLGLCGGFGLDQLRRLLRTRPVSREALVSAARGLAPLLASAALLVPVWIYFETLRVGGVLGETPLRFGLLEHVQIVLGYFARYELLAPAVCAKLAAWMSLRSRSHEAPPEALERSVETSHLLWLVLLAYGCATVLLPFSFERYVTVLVPILALVLILDGCTIFALARAADATPGSVWARRGALALWALCAAWLLPLRVAELPLRRAELETPYRGPVDYAVDFIRGAYPHPEKLVIATNYEAPPLMYYLGSRVTIGYGWPNLREDLTIPPDIIVRRSWLNDAPLLELEKGGRFETKTFEVGDLPVNNVPQISPNRFVPMTHQYRTWIATKPKDAFKILVRVPGDR
jgi:hypothetical protein